MTIAIRPFEKGDTQRLLKLFYDAVHTGVQSQYTLAQKDVWAPQGRQSGRWEQTHDRYTLVAELDNHIVGFADITHDGDIDHLYVDPAYHRKGIGMLLINACIKIAHKNGLRIITTAASALAKPLLIKAGFTITSEKSIEKNDVTFDTTYMQKILS